MMVVQCTLCPKLCLIQPGQSGECRIRVNVDGRLLAVTYGRPSAVHVDPVEKKPLFHFLPGTSILSLATVGCNLHCKNCQNWELSQENPENIAAHILEPKAVPDTARRFGCRSVAYTYSEPIVFYEYTLDTCEEAAKAGLRNVLVTAGYANKEPFAKLCRFVAAANIDLKAYSDKFYREICGATLKPVLDSLVLAKKMGVFVEVTNLLIPTLNDSDAEIRALCRWLAANLGEETPLHFSRFFPRYRMKNLPSTPAETLDRARRIAMGEGLRYVYIGNIVSQDGENTYCPQCEELLIKRKRYTILQNRIEAGQCPDCRREIPGVWT